MKFITAALAGRLAAQNRPSYIAANAEFQVSIFSWETAAR
jgi:hypothetical protein